jgi:hypothetical protein
LKLLALILLCFISTNLSALEISDFKSGLMCGINKDDMGWVCFDQREIQITGQSSCVSQGKQFKCTWYGHSFTYSNAKQNQVIDCTFSHSEPTHTVDLNSSSDEKTRTSEFSFSLDEGSGYFINPQYSALSLSENEKPLKIEQNVKCHIDGELLYEYGFTLIFPPDA